MLSRVVTTTLNRRAAITATAVRAVSSAATIPSNITFHLNNNHSNGCGCGSCAHAPGCVCMACASTRKHGAGCVCMTCNTTSKRTMTTVADACEKTTTADDALKYSGYQRIDFTICENDSVYDAVQKFAAFDVGCLVTTDAAGNMTGVISERDYITKIALLGRTSKDTKVKEIATVGPRIVTASADETVESCMEKMMAKNIRHLPVVDEKGSVMGMISIKDLVKTVVSDKDETIKVLSDFALGKGGHFGSE